MKEENLLNAIDLLTLKGYSDELIWEVDHIFVPHKNLKLYIEDFYIDVAYRFECSNGKEDCSAIFAISSPVNEVKGLLIDYYDEISSLEQNPFTKKLSEKIGFKDEVIANIDHRYNLRKVYKKDFEEEPSRYILRIKFPDFPACPFGHTFKMLGYDTLEKTYVWFVTSILKDGRLEIVNYDEIK